MSRIGWVKVHRKIMDWEWYTDANTFRVFMHLLFMASFSDDNYRGHKLEPGQVPCGRKQLARDLNISEQSVRTSLQHLKSTNEITIKSTNKFSIITIENWAFYQTKCDDDNQQNDQQIPNNQPATNHTKEYKNIRTKEDKNIPNSNKAIYSRETEEIIDYLNEVCGTRYRSSGRKTRDLIQARMKEGFTVEDFKTVIFKKAKQWQNDPKMCKFLRPETLFSNKFEGYLNERMPLTFEERLAMA